MSQYKELAAVYDDLINSDVDYRAWAHKIIDICDELGLERKNYLDLGCGTGNMTQLLSKTFKICWAVDISPEMLTEAENKLRNNGIKAKLVCQDICDLKLNQSFDLITCCLDSTNYILETEKLKNYFRSVYKHLKDGGVFIFDINSYYKLTEILGNNTYSFDNEQVVYLWENYLEEDIVQMKLIFFIKEEDKYKRFDEFHEERAYSEEYLEKLVADTGFNIVKKLDNYEDRKIEYDTERITYVLTK